MKLQRLALVVPLLFLAGFVPAAAGELAPSWLGAGQASCLDGSSCPDPDNHGHPCGPACPCACCPGHQAATAASLTRPSIGIPPANSLEACSAGDLHPKDVPHRIFHPPRV
jgi:hypothetical protein